MPIVKLTPHEIAQVMDFMRRECGNDFTEKETLVNSKMSLMCAQLGYHHFYDFWDDVKRNNIASAALRQQVIDALTTNYSYFYREDDHFARLADLISAGNLPVGNNKMRVWSAGCSTGEEVYNIAMVLEDARRGGLLANDYEIIGSDVSSKVIRASKEGRYDVADVSHMPPHWRSRYCLRSGTDYEIKKSLRDHVEFRLENVLAPRFDAPFDVVMCRNMMIYFDKSAIDKFCSLLQGKVKPGGYLFLGHAEILSTLQGFTYVEPSIWRRDVNPNDLLGNLANFGIAGYLIQ